MKYFYWLILSPLIHQNWNWAVRALAQNVLDRYDKKTSSAAVIDRYLLVNE